MARYTGPKDKLSRREGIDLFNKGDKLTRLNTPPGMHGRQRHGKNSLYGQQLREKQKLKRLFGILERQMQLYVRKALRTRGNTEDALLSQLERRLDNVVFRMHLARTRMMARQLVAHGHIRVNGRRMTVPSYQTRVGDVISLKQHSADIAGIKELLSTKGFTCPRWLRFSGTQGEIIGLPTAEDVGEPIEIRDIIEFYSR